MLVKLIPLLFLSVNWVMMWRGVRGLLLVVVVFVVSLVKVMLS